MVSQLIKKEVVLLSVVSKLHAVRMKHRINGFLFMSVLQLSEYIQYIAHFLVMLKRFIQKIILSRKNN
jgi:hypothetical protein